MCTPHIEREAVLCHAGLRVRTIVALSGVCNSGSEERGRQNENSKQSHQIIPSRCHVGSNTGTLASIIASTSVRSRNPKRRGEPDAMGRNACFAHIIPPPLCGS